MGGFAANRDYAASNSSRHSLASISVDPCVCRGLESRQNWMKIRSICLALFMLGHAGGMCAQNSEAFTPIGQSAVATLHVRALTQPELIRSRVQPPTDHGSRPRADNCIA